MQTIIQEEIKRKEENKCKKIKRIQIERGEFEHQEEEQFGSLRKLCKNNITQRTKFLIEKLKAKKKTKESKNIQQKILNQAKETANMVKLDYEMEAENEGKKVYL